MGQAKQSRLGHLVGEWQQLPDSDGRSATRRANLLAQILRRCEPLVYQFFAQMLSQESRGELDDLVNETLARVGRTLAAYDSTRSSFESWLKYQCVRPVFKQHLETIGYRSVDLESYIAALKVRLQGRFESPTNIAERVVEALKVSEVRNEFLKMRRLVAEGRRVVLKRDPRRVPLLPLQCPNWTDGGSRLPELAAQPLLLEMDEACQEVLGESLNYLTTGQKMVIVGVFFQSRPKGQLAQEAGVSSSRISQLLKQALVRLREVLGLDFFRNCLPGE